MSADNGVYVLQTYGPEYRVAYAQAIDNIFGKFNDETLHWDGDDAMIATYFKESEVFGTLDEALDKAEFLAEEYEYLEDGVCVIREFSQKKFSEL
jgi:hypothetical protein